ncbi:MAG: HipA domain-containing protein [bacterium]|nr:HipA domain-containing protein [bacterium]
MKRCRICGKEITRGNNPIHHPICIKRMFGTGYIPRLAVSPGDIPTDYKKEEDKFSISCIQPKIPLQLNRKKKQLELGDESGEFILKPGVDYFANLPQIEYICMTAASLMGIAVPPRYLVPLGDSGPAYVTRRIHRPPKEPPVKKKTLREIMGKEKKYSGDLVDIGLKIWDVSEFPGLDVQLFFEMVLFSFIVGHSDLHLESFSVLYDGEGNARLAPAYDIVSAKLFLPDSDDFAIPLEGKINAIRGKNFMNSSQRLKIHEKAYAKLFLRFFRGKRQIGRLIKESSLSTEEKVKFADVINERFRRLFS